jgi:hypothetical protein
MKSCWHCLGVALLVTAVSRVAPPVEARPNSPDAFVRTEVRSVDQLSQIVAGNPRVRRNFARHFGIPESQVATYFRRNLVLTRLPEDRNVTVYAVTRTGRIYPVRERLRRGSRVFALKNGEPVLKGLCANPMVRRLPPMVALPPPTPVIPRPPQTVPPVVRPPTPPEVPLPPPTTTFLPPVPPETVVPLVPVPLEPVPVGEAPPLPPSVVEGPPPGGRPFNPAWLLAAGLPFFFGGDDDNPSDRPRPFVPPPVIPEPGTWLLLGTGLPLAGLALRQSRRPASHVRGP